MTDDRVASDFAFDMFIASVTPADFSADEWALFRQMKGWK